LLLSGLLREITAVLYSVGCTAKMDPWHYKMNKREGLWWYLVFDVFVGAYVLMLSLGCAMLMFARFETHLLSCWNVISTILCLVMFLWWC
jgi:hypothetical protein